MLSPIEIEDRKRQLIGDYMSIADIAVLYGVVDRTVYYVLRRHRSIPRLKIGNTTFADVRAYAEARGRAREKPIAPPAPPRPRGRPRKQPADAAAPERVRL